MNLVAVIEYLKFGSLISFIGKYTKKISFTIWNCKRFTWHKIISEKTLNIDETDENVNAYVSRKLQPVAVKILHPGIKGQLRYEIYHGLMENNNQSCRISGSFFFVV